MSLSKYPNRLDMFETKKDAQFSGDPNGDFVMAEDINVLQDAISAIENSLGTSPQGTKTSVGERITLLEGSSSLRVPSFLIYLGNPALINESETLLEAMGHFAKYDHVVLGNNAMNENDPDHSETRTIIEGVRSSKDMKFYGHIDCGVNTFNLSLSELQNQIQSWMDMGMTGIYCANFGFESRVSRERQNDILDSIHQHDMVAILNAKDPEQLFTDIYHETMNPNWLPSRAKAGDVYHYDSYALDTSRPGVYEASIMTEITMLIKLYDYRVNQGIRIFGTPRIDSTVPKEEAQGYYDYAHVSALVTSLDAFHPVTEGYSELTNFAPTYDWVPIAGSWYMTSPRVEYDDYGIECVRETPFGRIILNTQEHTYRYEGIYIPYNLLKIAANTIEGNLLKDATVEDVKIKNYNGDRLIQAINADVTPDSRINVNKIMDLSYGNIGGDIPASALSLNVITALEANIGKAKISSALIGDLTAGHITSGTIDAGHIKGSVIQAIQLYADEMVVGDAVINKAVIGDLNAEKITSGHIKTEVLEANVVNAINLTAQGANITDLHAKNITAGDIKAERIQAQVIQALNLYAESMVVGDAVIDNAVIGDLTAGHIRASVIEAINGHADSFTINAAKIGELDVDNIKAAVIGALEANIGTATIDSALIGELSASKIVGGTIDADLIKGSVITAINFNTEIASIGSAAIESLEAGKIISGDIRTDVLQANVVSAINAYAETMTVEDAFIESAVIGNLEARHIEASVISAINLYAKSAVIDKATIDAAAIGSLSVDNMKAAVFSAIDANITNARIKGAHIGSLEVESMQAQVFNAIEANITDAKIDGAHIGELTAGHITSGSIDTEQLIANVVKAINAEIQNVQIEEAKIVDLQAEKIVGGQIKAEVLTANVVKAINAELQTVLIDQAKIGNLSAKKITADDIDALRMTANVVDAINVYAETVIAGDAVIDSAAIGVLQVEHIQAKVISAINASVETIEGENAIIDNAKIGTLRADQIEAVVIGALEANIGTATIDSALIGKLTAANLDAGIINSTHITTVGLDADDIKTGTFHGDMITGNTLDALKIKAGTITGREVMAGSLTAKEIQAGSITSEEIQSGSISAEHISTVGLDAQLIRVYNSGTGQTLIGDGFLRVDGLDAGVVQSDNLVANGMFMTASSAFGLKRENPAGEVIIGTESQVPGGNQVWKYDLETGAFLTAIDVPGKKPAFIAIDGLNQYAYVTVQGNDSLAQIDLAYDVITDQERPMGKSPTRVKFTGDLLGDMKHLFAVNTDKTDLNAPDSFYVLDVPPHSDFSQFYIHHQIITGNTPYDFVLSEKDKKVYITLSDQGDIAVLDASKFPTYQWKLEGAIPISPYGTDNYHGGMTAGYGLGTAVGGDASAEYNKDGAHAGHGGMNHGGHGGYSVSDGTMKEYKPHGIAIDKKENLLIVTEVEQNELVIINRIDESDFDWPMHPSYMEPGNIELVNNVIAVTDIYDNNPELALADGYAPASPYIPYMGYHFAKKGPGTYDPEMPNTLMYAFDTTVNQYRLIGAEWNVPDPTIPVPVPGTTWAIGQPAMAVYEDGLMIPSASYEEAAKTHPETGSSLVSWNPAIWGVHLYTKIPNPLGLFEEFNPRCKPFNATSPFLPPGFESYIDPNMPDSNYHEYTAPPTEGGHGGHGGGGTDDGGMHHHSVESAIAEPEFNTMAGEHTMEPDEGGHDEHDMGDAVGPNTDGQGLVYKYVRHRFPVGDDPEFIEIANGKIWITVKGGGEVVVMDETDLYRTPEDLKYHSWEHWIRRIKVGAKPLDMTVDTERNRLYVTLNGDNQVAVIDMTTEQVLDKWTAGANTMGSAITPDGKYLYVTNNGGVGELSFVYPEGAYIGDAFIGLEGDVQYQGALNWVPDRSDWVWKADGTIRSSSTVEFRINEPFLNEGGYVKLSTQGVDSQHAAIEQDVYNVSNFSNGNNMDTKIGERLAPNLTMTTWKPLQPWVLEGNGVENVRIAYLDADGIKQEIIPSPTEYTIHYDTPRIEFLNPVAPEGAVSTDEVWVEADYVFQANVHFKNHNASVLIALENSSSKNFKTLFEVEEFVPKFITMDNQGVAPFNYEPIIDPSVTPEHYRGIEYSVATNRAHHVPLENISTNAIEAETSWGLEAVVNGLTSSGEYFATKSAEMATLALTSAPTSVGAVTVTLDGVATTITVGDGLAEVATLDLSGVVSTDGNVTVTLNGVAQNVAVSNGEYENATLNITSGPTVAGEAMLKLNGIMTMVPLDPAVETTASAVAQKIRSLPFAGWDVTGTGTNVVFTATGIGARLDSVYGDNGTGAVGTVTTTVQGANPDSASDVAQKIRTATFTGWTTSGADNSVVFTSTAKQARPSAVYGYAENATGTTGTIAVTVSGSDSDTIDIAAEKIRNTVFAGWITGGLAGDVTFESISVGNKTDALYSAGTTGATGTMTTTNHGVDGSEYIQIDLGATYMIGKLTVWHFWQDMRTYHGTKTEVSEDGITWETVFDSATAGEYMEMKEGHTIKFWAYPDGPENYEDNYLQAKRVRYVRDWAHGNTVNANNHWAEIQVFGDWEFETTYAYAAGSAQEGEQLATNGEGLVTTDILGASATLELDINFTSWWYMTYLVGPAFGSFDVEMPTVMGGSHVLPLDNPYINKVAHRHIMAFPPGKHTAILKQRSGKVAIDRMRFEDFQYYGTTQRLIPNTADTSFTRYKVIPEKAKNYIGSGNQSTYGPYDTPYINTGTMAPDQSVPLKYRVRVKSQLDSSGITDERGIAYVTSAIFEQGRQSSHWRPSSSSDVTPGNRIESWDGNQPHKTGIQWFHLANGSIRGTKILPSALMDYHVSPYARIGEYKLDLNHPTHEHGHYMTNADGTQYFMDNKPLLDIIMGFGDSGTSNKMARADHTHTMFMNDIMVHGNVNAMHAMSMDGNHDWASFNGVEVVGLKNSFDGHVANTDLHFSAAERTKLANISTQATRTVGSGTNGNVLIDGVETQVYSHPSTDGSLHVPATSTTNDNKVLKAGTLAGSLSWEFVSWSEVIGKPSTFTPPVANGSTLGGVKVGSGLAVDGTGILSWTHPTGSGNRHIPAGGSNGDVLKYSAEGTALWAASSWSEISDKPTSFPATTHSHTTSQITDLNTVLANYATKEELASAGEVQLDSVNTFTNQNVFTYAGGPAIVIKPSTAPAANTVVLQIANTLGGNLVTIDAEGDMTIEANLTVKGTTTYNGTNEVVGDYSITGDMNIGGSTILGDSATDQTTVKGDLVVEGSIIPKGKSVEAGRIMVFGMGGDLQFQSDSTVYEDVISHYSTFDTGTWAAFDEPATGATRKYRLLVAYSTVGSVSMANLKITQYNGADIVDFNLPEVWGSETGMVRHIRTVEFTTTYTGHTTFKALSAGTDKDLIIKQIEVIAYDYFA